MKKRPLCFLLCLALFGCSTNNGISNTKDKPIVLVSVAPYVELIQQIAGNTVDVQCAVPPGVDPHNWEPTYKDMDRLQGAKAWFTVGEEFEPRLSVKLYETSPDLVIYKLQEETPNVISNHDHDHDHVDGFHYIDSHFWLDPILDIHQGRFIERVLSTISPESSAMYKANLKKLEASLLALNEWAKKEIANAEVDGKYLVTTHGAYTYYCGRYGLYQIVIEPSGGKEPRTKDIARIVDQIQKQLNSVVGVFLQPAHSNKAALIIADQLNLPTYMIDPYQQNYIETIRSLTLAVTTKHDKEKITSFHELDEKEETVHDLFYSEPEPADDE